MTDKCSQDPFLFLTIPGAYNALHTKHACLRRCWRPCIGRLFHSSESARLQAPLQHRRQTAAGFGAQTCKSCIFVAHEVGAGRHIDLTALEARLELRPYPACLPGVLMTVPAEAGPNGSFTAHLKGRLYRRALATWTVAPDGETGVAVTIAGFHNAGCSSIVVGNFWFKSECGRPARVRKTALQPTVFSVTCSTKALTGITKSCTANHMTK